MAQLVWLSSLILVCRRISLKTKRVSSVSVLPSGWHQKQSILVMNSWSITLNSLIASIFTHIPQVINLIRSYLCVRSIRFWGTHHDKLRHLVTRLYCDWATHWEPSLPRRKSILSIITHGVWSTPTSTKGYLAIMRGFLNVMLQKGTNTKSRC